MRLTEALDARISATTNEGHRGAFRRILHELEIGGVVDGNVLDDLKSSGDYTPKQMVLFPGVPAEPTLPKGMKIVGRIGVYYVVRSKEPPRDHYRDAGPSYTYYLFDSGVPVAYVCVIHPDSEFGDYWRQGLAGYNPDLRGTGFRVVSVFVSPEARGQRLASKLYLWLLENECDYILPDETHTTYGVKLWKQIVSDPQFDVFIFNHRNYEFYRATPGVVWRNVYRSRDLAPFITLRGHAESLIPE